MKIVYLSDSRVPSDAANSVHVVKMASALASIGHEVVLHCYATTDDWETLAAQYDIEHAFGMHNYTDVRLPVARRIWRMIEARQSLSRQQGVELIYGRDLYGLLAVAGAGVPIVFEAHTPPVDGLSRKLIGHLISLESFQRLVVISAALRDDYLALYDGLDADRVQVAHDGADAVRNRPRPIASWPGRSGHLQLGYAGSLFPGKGAELVRDLARRCPRYDFHIVGGSASEIAQFKDKARGDNLYMHGRVEHAQVAAYLAHLDIALFPTQASVMLPSGVDIGRWTSPLKLFEYMAAGKPIVGSDLAIVREVLSDGETALLVPPLELSDWEAAFARLEQDAELRTRLAEKARFVFENGYTWKQRALSITAPR